jgi:predicted glutamine amidotransferase
MENRMCRWIAYSGGAIPIEELVFNPEHSLVDQSMSAHMAPQPTNGDGFGVGWYGRDNEPGIYRSTQPAWNDANLRDLSHHIASPLFLAHVRRSTGTPVQSSNCHPFRHENWLFVHNGLLRGFQEYRREMVMGIAPELFPELRGSTDSELMFFLALTFGLKDDPFLALEKMVGFIERLAEERGIENAIQMTLGVTDGKRLYTVRYSTERNSRTLFYSESVESVLALYPNHEKRDILPKDARAVVSEPLGSLEGIWIPIDESTCVIVEAGEVTNRPFVPKAA